LVAAAKFWVAALKKLFVVPNFVAVTKPFFPCSNADNKDNCGIASKEYSQGYKKKT